MSRSAHAKPTDEQDKILLRLFFLLTADKKPRWKQVACQQLPFNLIYLKQIRFLQTGGDGLSTASCRATFCASQSRYTAKLPSDASPWQQDTPSQRRMSSGLVDTSNEVSRIRAALFVFALWSWPCCQLPVNQSLWQWRHFRNRRMNLIDFICLAVFIWRIKFAVDLNHEKVDGNHGKSWESWNWKQVLFLSSGEYSDLHEARIGNQWQTGILYLKSVRYTHHE